MEWRGGEEILFIALIFTLYSGYEYVRDYFKNVKM